MNKEFWKAALIRAVRTIAQTAIATIGTTAVIEQVNWIAVLSASALAGVLSVLTSVGTGLPEVDNNTSLDTGDVRKPPNIDQENKEASCRIKVIAYEDYDDNGDPIVFPDEEDGKEADADV